MDEADAKASVEAMLVFCRCAESKAVIMQVVGVNPRAYVLMDGIHYTGYIC